MYSQPASSYVATFLGTTNLFPATVTEIRPDGLVCRVGSYDLAVGTCEHDPAVGDAVSVMVRPERVEVCPVGGGADRVDDGSNLLAGKVEALVFRERTGVILDLQRHADPGRGRQPPGQPRSG